MPFCGCVEKRHIFWAPFGRYFLKNQTVRVVIIQQYYVYTLLMY